MRGEVMRPLVKVSRIFCIFAVMSVIVLGTGLLFEAAAGVDFPSADLPPESNPPDCENLTSLYAGSEIHAVYPGPIVMTEPRYKCFRHVYRQAVGFDEAETFDCLWECTMDFGTGPVSVEFAGPGTHMVFNRLLGTAGVFSCEIIELSLVGTAGGYNLELRESPTLASTGITDIADIGGGLYYIDSFFDVFTELSVDGGPWMSQTTDAARITLVTAESVPTQPTAWGGIKALYR
jgi:hypothetical protein